MATQSNPVRNVLLVVAEDMGPQLGLYGCGDARTPRLDAFGRNGIGFRNAWCAFPMCSPGRSALLTGLAPHENGQMGLSTCGFRTFDGVPSLPAILNKAGYRTGLFGKLHVLPEEAFPFHLHWRDPEFGFMARNNPKMISAVDEFIGDGRTPFFAMVALPDAHLPYLRQSFGDPPDPITGAEVGPAPGMDRIIPEWAEWYADYHNCIRRVDSAFGGLLDLLARKGLSENTLIIFTADHGLQFPRGKLSLYEPGLSIPLLMGGAGVEHRAALADTPVGQTDVFATILKSVGLPLPEPAEGEDLVKIAAGDEDRFVYGEITACMPRTYFPQRAVRNKRFKLIWTLNHDTEEPYYQNLMREFSSPGETAPPHPPNSSGRPPIPPAESLSPAMRIAYERWRKPPRYQLYDLLEDPNETRNLSGAPQWSAVEDELRQALTAWQKDTDDFVLDEARRLPFEEECRAYVDQSRGGTRPRDFAWQYPRAWRPRRLRGGAAEGDATA